MSGRHFLFLTRSWVEEYLSAAGLRTQGLIRDVMDAGHRVSILSSRKWSPAAERLHRSFQGGLHWVGGHADLQEGMKLEKVTDVVYDTYVNERRLHHRVSQAYPHAHTILDTQDLHSLRLAREQMLQNDGPRLHYESASSMASLLLKEAQRATMMHRGKPFVADEMESIRRCDQTLVISAFEEDILRKMGLKSTYVPFRGDELPPSARAKIDRDARGDVIFVGSASHSPNVDGLLWFHQHVSPLLADTGIQVSVYGSNQTPALRQLQTSNFRVAGHFPGSIGSLLRKHRVVNIAPLRYGAGLKGKIATAMQYGVPTVTTSIGAEGMMEGENCTQGVEGYEGGGLVVCDQAAAFAEACRQLSTDGPFWHLVGSDAAHAFSRMFCTNRNVRWWS